ncbi:unnamed protein product, partial [Polarella glacialis]
MKRGADGAIGMEPSLKRPPPAPPPAPAAVSSSGSGGSPGGPAVPRTRHAFKALITDGLAASLLGSGGSVKDEIQKETGARLVCSSRGDYFPSTRYRVMGIYSDDPSTILDVFGCIMPTLVEQGDEERRQLGSSDKQSDLTGKEPGEYIFRFCVTRRMQSQLVGTGGCNIKHIRHDSGAKVFLENESVMGHRTGKIIGTPETLLTALRLINEFVQCESEYEEEFYQGFARLVNFSEAEANGWQPPSEPKDGDKPRSARRNIGPGGVVNSATNAQAAESILQVPPAPPPAVPHPAISPVAKSSVSERLLNLNALPKAPPKSLPSLDGGSSSSSSVLPPPPPVPAASDPNEDVDALADALESFPSGTVRLQYSVCCELPAARISAIVGEAGDFLKQVEEASGVAVDIDREGGDWHDANRMMTLVGPLLNIYVAHAMVMSRLRRIEADEAREARELE